MRSRKRTFTLAQRSRSEERCCGQSGCPGPHACTGARFYQVHYEPTFACANARRIGGAGDGGKWICDPLGIQDKIEQGGRCLVYSIGSNGDYSFESAVYKEVSPSCEIHTIDQHNWTAYTLEPPPRYMSYHVNTIGPEPLTTVPALVKQLGHDGVEIDIFKIDCEGCEWSTYRSWVGDGVPPRQILVELHNTGGTSEQVEAHDFFSFLFDQGYVVSHKEPNTAGCGGDCIGYAFLHLGRDFSRATSV